MPAIPNPSVGGAINASAQLLFQREIQVGAGVTWASKQSLYGQNVPEFGEEDLPIRLSGLPSVRVQLLLYPEYDTGLGSFQARNDLAWRLVGVLPPIRPREFSDLIPSAIAGPSTVVRYTPLTTPQLLPVGVPITAEIPVGGPLGILVQLNTGGPPPPGKGVDLILMSISAGAS